MKPVRATLPCLLQPKATSRGTQRIVVGGGLRASRFGELAIGRAGVLLKASKHDVEHWGVMTIGTGLGIARFTNRKSNKA